MPKQAHPPAQRAGVHATCGTIRSDELFHGAQELQIEHRGRIYRRRTSLGKLIPTK